MARFRRVQRLATGAAAFFAAAVVFLSLPAAENPDEPNRDQLGHSAQLRSDRNIEVLLAAARTQIAAGQFDAGIEALERVLAANDERFVSDSNGGRQVAASIEANRLLAGVPREHLQRWESRAGATIRAGIEQAAATGDDALLAAVASRYECTAVGRETLSTAAALHFDQGRFAESAQLYRKLAENKLAEDATRGTSAAKLAVAWNRAGDIDRARRWVREHRSFIDSSPVSAGGTSLRLTDWLRDNVPGIFDAPTKSNLDSDAHPRTAILPAVEPIWIKPQYAAENLSQFVRDSLGVWRSQGIPVLGSHVPHIAGKRAIVRGLDDLTAIDVETGATLWKKPVSELALRIDDNPKLMENERIAHLYSEAICERLLVDRVKGTLSSDGERVYGIIDNATPDESDSWTRSRRGGFREAPLRTAMNHLVAWKLGDGEEVWKVGEIDNADESSTDDPEKCFFHAPVVAHGKSLLVIVSVESELRLVSLAAATGQQEWSTVLADVPRNAVTDRRHQKLACPIVVAGGKAVCCTSAGAVIAVDLSTRRSSWAYRYGRNDAPRARLVIPGRWAPERNVNWWNGWQHEMAAEWNGEVIVATSESDAIRAFALEDGRLLWERPRGDGLFVAGVFADRLVVVETTRVCCLDPLTGKDLWTATTGAPAGRGAFAKATYTLPLADGRIVGLRLLDGKTIETRASGSELQHLVVNGDVFVAQSTDRIARLVTIDESHRTVTQRLKSSPDDVPTALLAAVLERQSGRFGAAREVLDRIPGGEKLEPVRSALRETIIEEVQSNPSKLAEVTARMEALGQHPRERFDWLLASAEAVQSTGDFAAAFDLCLQAMPLALSTELADSTITPSGEGVARQVRVDRALRGRMIDIANAAPPEGFASLDAVAQKFLVKATIQPDPYAIERFAPYFTGLPWESFLRQRNAERASGSSEFIPAQLRWIELSSRGRAASRQEALLRLAELYEARSYPSDAAACYRQLRSRYPVGLVRGSQSADQVIAELKPESPVAREIAGGRTVPWGTGEATISEGESRYQGSTFAPLPVEADRGSLFDRISVYLDAQGKTIRFQGDEFRTAWQLNLPETRSPLRAITQLGRGWGIGQLLILRLGTDIFGISPLNDRGEPDAKILWKIESAVREESRWGPPDFRYHVARIGFGPDTHDILDHFAWKMGDVGPVRAGYLCYRDQAKLIAFDSFTGKELWRREQLPRETLVTGDEEHLFLIHADSVMEIVRTIDGKTIDSTPSPAKTSDVVSLAGEKALVVRGQQDTPSLERVNLRTGLTDWQLPLKKGAVPFRCDNEIVGVIDLDGWLRLLSIDNGREISRTQVTRPQPLASIHVGIDERAYYVALSRPAFPPRGRRRDDFSPPRNPLVDGTLLAFERATGAMLWSQPLPNGAFRLDQPRETPFLVLHYRQAPTDDGYLGDLVTRCLDKRTGREILLDEQSDFGGGGYWTIDTRPDDRAVELVLPSKTVRFQYPR